MINFNMSDACCILGQTPHILRQTLQYLPENWLQANEGADTFSPFDVIGHLVHGEKSDWIQRTRIILEYGETRPFQPFDRFAMYEESKGKDIKQLLDEFDTLRAENLRQLSLLNITAEDLEKRGQHPVLEAVTLRQLLATWVAHDMTHLAQIARVMAKQYKQEVGPWAQFLNVLHDRENTVGPN